MKKATLLCTFIIAATSNQITCSSYAKRIEQTAFNNSHRHPQHGGANYFATIKFEKATQEARAAQIRTSPTLSSNLSKQPFSPQKDQSRTISL